MEMNSQNAKIPVSNTGESAIYVGGKMIPPGETRVFEAGELPPEYRPEAPATDAAPAGDDPLLTISALSVGKLEAGLPDLGDEELARLEALEQAKEKPRAGALAVITAERLRRAEKAAPGGLDNDSAPGGEGGAGGEGGGE